MGLLEGYVKLGNFVTGFIPPYGLVKKLDRKCKTHGEHAENFWNQNQDGLQGAGINKADVYDTFKAYDDIRASATMADKADRLLTVPMVLTGDLFGFGNIPEEIGEILVLKGPFFYQTLFGENRNRSTVKWGLGLLAYEVATSALPGISEVFDFFTSPYYWLGSHIARKGAERNLTSRIEGRNLEDIM